MFLVAALACCLGCDVSQSGTDPAVPPASTDFDQTSTDFDTQVLQNEQAVLVDFWAPWCGPCRAMEPTIEAIANKYEGQLVVVKINIDDHPDLAERYEISGIPAFLLFQNGQVMENIVGGRSEAELTRILQPYLQGKPASQ